jgi:hypothetical protein
LKKILYSKKIKQLPPEIQIKYAQKLIKIISNGLLLKIDKKFCHRAIQLLPQLDIPPEVSLSFFLKLLSSPQEKDILYEIFRALHSFEGQEERIISELSILFSTCSSQRKIQILQFFFSLREPSTFSHLKASILQLIRDPSAEIRKEALSLFSYFKENSEETIDILIKCLKNDPSFECQFIAMYALISIGSPAKRAGSAMIQFFNKLQEELSALSLEEETFTSMEKAKRSYLKISLRNALESIGDFYGQDPSEEILQFFLESLKCEDFYLNEISIMFLADWKERRALDPLLQKCLHEENPRFLFKTYKKAIESIGVQFIPPLTFLNLLQSPHYVLNRFAISRLKMEHLLTAENPLEVMKAILLAQRKLEKYYQTKLKEQLILFEHQKENSVLPLLKEIQTKGGIKDEQGEELLDLKTFIQEIFQELQDSQEDED